MSYMYDPNTHCSRLQRHHFVHTFGHYLQTIGHIRVFLETNFRGGQTNVSRIRGEGGGRSLEIKYTN